MTREKQVSVVIRAKDNASKAIKGLKGSLLSLKSLAITGLGFIGFNRLLKETVGRAQSAETGLKKLGVAMRAAGRSSAENLEFFKDLSVELERTTGILEEDVLQSLAVLQTFGQMSRADMEKTIVAAMNMSTVFGETLQQSAIRLGKAYNGNLRGLQMMGVGISAATVKAKGFQAVLDQLAIEQGGQAVARMAGFEGGVNRLSVAFGEVGKEAGKYVTQSGAVREVIDSMAGGFNIIAKALKDNRKLTHLSSDAIDAHVESLKKQREELEKQGKDPSENFLVSLKEQAILLEEQIIRLEVRNNRMERSNNLASLNTVTEARLNELKRKRALLEERISIVEGNRHVTGSKANQAELKAKEGLIIFAEEEKRLTRIAIEAWDVMIKKAEAIKALSERATEQEKKRKDAIIDRADEEDRAINEFIDAGERMIQESEAIMKRRMAIHNEVTQSAQRNLERRAELVRKHNDNLLSQATALADKEISARQRVADKIANIRSTQLNEALRDENLNWAEKNDLISEQEDKASSLFTSLTDGSINTATGLEQAFNKFDKLKESVTDVEGAENVLDILKAASNEIATLSERFGRAKLSPDIDVAAMTLKMSTAGEKAAIAFREGFERKLRSSPLDPTAGIKSSFTQPR